MMRKSQSKAAEKHHVRSFLRNLAIDLGVYGVLLLVYFFLVLRYLGDFLTELLLNQQYWYAFLGLGIIVTQAVLLDVASSAIVNFSRLKWGKK